MSAAIASPRSRPRRIRRDEPSNPRRGGRQPSAPRMPRAKGLKLRRPAGRDGQMAQGRRWGQAQKRGGSSRSSCRSSTPCGPRLCGKVTAVCLVPQTRQDTRRRRRAGRARPGWLPCRRHRRAPYSRGPYASRRSDGTRIRLWPRCKGRAVNRNAPPHCIARPRDDHALPWPSAGSTAGSSGWPEYCGPVPMRNGYIQLPVPLITRPRTT